MRSKDQILLGDSYMTFKKFFLESKKSKVKKRRKKKKNRVGSIKKPTDAFIGNRVGGYWGGGYGYGFGGEGGVEGESGGGGGAE